jgi:hypothetical protein
LLQTSNIFFIRALNTILPLLRLYFPFPAQAWATRRGPYTDVAIIGGGLAGSPAAAMLGRASVATIQIDPHPTYPFDFRVEKLSGAEQTARPQDRPGGCDSRQGHP